MGMSFQPAYVIVETISGRLILPFAPWIRGSGYGIAMSLDQPSIFKGELLVSGSVVYIAYRDDAFLLPCKPNDQTTWMNQEVSKRIVSGL